MSEPASLVSWDSHEERGKILGSDWVCPTGSLDELGAFERDGGVVTDEVIQDLADGRPQHLELIEFPEGYKAVKVVDSETGDVLTGERHTSRYAGIISCNCGALHDIPAVTSVISQNAFPIGEGVEVASVYNSSGGTQTVLKPVEVDRSEPDYLDRLRTATHITPQANKLFMAAEGQVGAIEGGHAILNVQEKDSNIESKLMILVGSGSENTGQLNLDLGADGQVEKVAVFKSGLLEALGVSVSCELDSRSHWGEIVDPKQRAIVLDAAAEAIGFDERWHGIDLKLTASGLYAAMGKRNPDPASLLVPAGV